MPTDIMSFAYQIFKDFGENAVLGGVIIYLLWKLATNHLHHLGMDIQANNTKLDNLSKDVKACTTGLSSKIDAVNSKVELLESKTAKIEGKIGI